MEEKYYNEEIDFFYCIINNYLDIKNIIYYETIKEELENSPNTKEWLNKTLYWVTYKEG